MAQNAFTETDIKFMHLVLSEAKLATQEGEVPIACILVKDGKVIAKARNSRENKQIVTKHAELEAIRKASEKLNTWRLDDVDCYVNLEPCHMCASALQQARIRKVYFGAKSYKNGALVSIDNFYDRFDFNHKVLYQGGLLETEASQLISNFFKKRRQENKALEEKLGGRSERKAYRKED